MLSAVILIAIMQRVSMLIGIMLSVAMQSVIILSVGAPSKTLPQTISKILARIFFFFEIKINFPAKNKFFVDH
jgi:hypothetical protein